jgi:pyridoxamine 5'-phosphate oxidase
MKSDVGSLRNEYLKSTLEDGEFALDPLVQFRTWFDEAVESNESEPNAMILATLDSKNQPRQRTVLLKGYDEDGFVFFTNYKSNKGHQIETNPKVNLIFPWFHLQRQVIICGKIEKTSIETSEEYFHSRPKGSQLSAYVSNQSETIPSREFLEAKLEEAKSNFKDEPIPLPSNWGGYLVKPISYEFWQGRENRLHDRIFFEWKEDSWNVSRLAP